LFDETNLPGAAEKMALYLKGKELLTREGYVDIGMDHFSTVSDDLYKAWKNGKLHRNFMGYTTRNSGMLVGLGVSSISDIENAFAQNDKTIHDYYAAINAGKLAIKKGFFLSEEDMLIRRNILDIICKGSLTFSSKHLELLQEYTFPQLELLKEDGLVEYDNHGLKVTKLGHHFIRNICSAFDMYIQRSKTTIEKPIFSKAI
jgi:oxygen-independent coproporphyrinogen-3 oxidase